MHVGNVAGHAALEGDNALGPGRELEHGAAIQVTHGGQNGQQAECQLNDKDDDDHVVRKGAAGLDTWISQTTPGEHSAADNRHHACDSANHDRHHLLGAGGHERLVERVRCQQAHQVTEEDHQYADMEQHAGHHHVFLAQHLAGMGFPGELALVIASPGTNHEDRDSNVGINPEQ